VGYRVAKSMATLTWSEIVKGTDVFFMLRDQYYVPFHNVRRLPYKEIWEAQVGRANAKEFERLNEAKAWVESLYLLSRS
jgi:hypothetical protein